MKLNIEKTSTEEWFAVSDENGTEYSIQVKYDHNNGHEEIRIEEMVYCPSGLDASEQVLEEFKKWYHTRQ